MALQTSEQQFCFNIHSLVTIVAEDMPVTIKETFLDYLGLFSVANKPQTVDIMLLPLMEKPQMSVPDSSIYNFWLSRYQDEPAISFSYRGEINIIMVFSEYLKIYYRPVNRNAEPLYSMVLYCIHLVLLSKNSLLFHGSLAVSTDNNTAVIFTGPRASKKTLLLLKLLKNGWHYLSDDRFILSKKTAYLFQSFINITEHHIDALPWLMSLNPVLPGLKRWQRLRKMIKIMAVRYLPSYLLPPLEQYYSTSRKLSINNIFQDVEIINSIKPGKIVILTFGLELELKPVSTGDMLSDVTAIQSLPFYQLDRLDKILFLSGLTHTDNLQSILADNLQQLDCFKLTVPYDYDIDRVYNELQRCLNAVL